MCFFDQKGFESKRLCPLFSTLFFLLNTQDYDYEKIVIYPDENDEKMCVFKGSKINVKVAPPSCLAQHFAHQTW